MDLVHRYDRLLAYDEWANREMLAGIARAGSPPKAVRLLGHVVGASRLWLARLERLAPPCAVWPEWPLSELSTQLHELPRAWQDWIGDVAPGDLDEPVDYLNSKGEKFTNTVADILEHVALHGTWHRGQIAAEIRAAGATPTLTDFIHAVRTGCLE